MELIIAIWNDAAQAGVVGTFFVGTLFALSAISLALPLLGQSR